MAFDHQVNTFWLTGEENFFTVFDVYYYKAGTDWKIDIAPADFVLYDFDPASISFEASFPINERTSGTLYIVLKEDTFDYKKVFVGNAEETRFITTSASIEFESYEVTAQEYLRLHWFNPSSKHGRDWGVSFVSIPNDPLVSAIQMSGHYKTFRENRTNQIIYFTLVLSGNYAIYPGNYMLQYVELENPQFPGTNMEAFYCAVTVP